MRANARRPQNGLLAAEAEGKPIPESLLGPLEQRVVGGTGFRMDPGSKSAFA